MKDYEQKHKEDLEEAKSWLAIAIENNDKIAIQILEKFFPELKEGEDERVRKELISFLRSKNGYMNPDEDWDFHNRWLPFLEKQGEPIDKGEMSDGYHTFKELYHYRMLYNAAFFNMLPKEWVHKSKKHHDGEECFGGGWFIVMAQLPTGQVSNHYELKDWDLFQIPEKETADEWDGHTPQEAADRLHKYLIETQGERKPILDFKAKDWYVSKVDGKIHNIYHSVDKVEPKFKVGDWVIYECGEDSATLQIKNIVDRTYEFTDDSTLNVVDEYALRLWTIQDAKKGDILQANKCTLIFDSLIKCIDGNTVISSWYSCDTETFYGMGTSQPDLWVTEGVVPATKKQCDLLFQKMKEAGLWDADKLELRMTKEESVLKEFVPKFKVGDWVVYKGLTCLVIKNVAEYTLKPCGSDLSQEVVVYYTDEDKLHLWTIEDAKPGDVLFARSTASSGIFILFYNIDENNNAKYYCAYDSKDGFIKGKKYRFNSRVTDCKPATKEQCNLFFQKMEEAGYEWDSEKKELKKIEQKMINEHNEHEPTSYEVEKWNEAYEKGYEIGYMNGKIEQKPTEWSKQQVVNALTNWLSEEIAPLNKKSLDGTITERDEMFRAALLEMRSFVNSPDFQIGKDTSAEWSEEDEKMFDSIIDCLDGLCFIDSDQLKWLKSIKQRIKGE